MTATSADDARQAGARMTPHPTTVAAGIVGLSATVVLLWAVQPLQFNVVTYEVARLPTVRWLPADLFPACIVGIVVAGAMAGGRGKSPAGRVADALGSVWPMALGAPFAVAAIREDSPSFFWVLVFIIGSGWAAMVAGRRLAVLFPRAALVHRAAPDRAQIDQQASRSAMILALGSLLGLIAVLTWVHTRHQVNYFDHFMMGHADVGHYAEELKNALAGRGLRCDSFPNTRWGWHFVPLMYVLVPFYALWPSPVFLMAFGALIVHLPAIPAFVVAKRRSGSALVGWLWGAAWLLLPSVSRIVYSNTYGFEWVYVSLPLMAVMLAAASVERWKWCWAMVALTLLCMETNASATLGFGLCLALFTARRRAGLMVAALSLAYAALCTYAIIPYFAASGRYERVDLFGELGTSLGSIVASAFTRPGEFWGRIVRPEGGWLIALLAATMFLRPFRHWRFSLAAVPTLFLIALLENPAWLSIKFWHHATILPFLFFAGLAVRNTKEDREIRWPSHLGVAAALVVSAAWGHYFFGLSPLSKSYEGYANDPFLQNPDPRLAFVERLRAAIPRDRTILATERMAAHFTDYRRLYTGGRARPADFVIIDRGDAWDTSDLPRRAEEFTADPHYRLHSEFGPVIVFERRGDAPPANLDDE